MREYQLYCQQLKLKNESGIAKNKKPIETPIIHFSMVFFNEALWGFTESHGSLVLLTIKQLLLAFKQLSDIFWLGQIKMKKKSEGITLTDKHWQINSDFPWVSFEKS